MSSTLDSLSDLLLSHSFHISIIIFTICIEFLIVLRDSLRSKVSSTSSPVIELSTILFPKGSSNSDLDSLIISLTLTENDEMASEYIFFAILSFIAIILLMIPFIWQVRRRNIAAALLVFWLQSDLLICLIDAIIWPTWTSVLTGWQGRGYCDFVVKWKIAAEFGGINASVMCIMITIYRMFWGMGMYRESTKSKKIRMLYEWGIAGLFPVLLAGLHYVVQPSRYYITPVFGCHPPIDNSWVSMIILIWPFVFSTVALVLVVLIMIKLQKHMSERSLLGLFQSNSNLDGSFRRLYMVVGLFTLIYYPTNIYGLVQFCISKMLPYTWDAVHADWWNTIYKIPDNPHFQYQRWIKVVAGWALFIIYGNGQEANQIYWEISKALHISREVQIAIWKYKLFKRKVKLVWMPKITPKWIKRISRSRELPLGGIAREQPKRGGWQFATFLKWCREKLKKKEGAIYLDSDRGIEEGALSEKTDALKPTLIEKIARSMRRIGRPKIHFEFSISWIRES
ncbi:hypothetical protein ABW20_dc0101805 [Dactylellina cionopaga]|nr:hypothetical protein ABW20_dc0101805 [Dactylellina cionopaga]